MADKKNKTKIIKLHQDTSPSILDLVFQDLKALEQQLDKSLDQSDDTLSNDKNETSSI